MPYTHYSVGTTEAKIAKVQKDRQSLAVVNNHATAIIYLGPKGVDSTNGFPVYSRGSITFSRDYGDDPTRELWCISDTAATPVRVYEGFVPAS